MRIGIYIQYFFSYILGLLFIYTAVRKMIDYNAHVAHIADVKFLSASIAYHAAYLVILAEMAIALLLLVPITRVQVWGWKLILPLMLVYTFYVNHVLNLPLFIPCSCKGVHDRLAWTDHYILNAGLSILALSMITLHYRIRKLMKKNNEEKELNELIDVVIASR
ncbi:MauE/DoxX family redox-associated membrane protein [Sphingobacterium faecale]|uniref:Methylamine utilisation protein MauE domain-containing protein n=1 Tax=Sphingobacterium faecale TaxID=2803775 RepID=A0ABS1R8Q8_9SPHI|nr:MauE/DoxX family redox-associated membrane protein [Sphingobacterium faecale]MBL1410377.1 hypothetical protein [Sphingobacterium faecale]